MGHHARTLSALLAVLSTTLVVASTAAAFPSVVRVETRDMNSIASGAFVNRTAVDTQGPVTITNADPLAVTPGETTTCAATSPVAAVMAAVGPAQVKTIKDPTTGKWVISSIKGVGQAAVVSPALNPPWFWRVYVDQGPVDNGASFFNQQDACGGPDVPIGSEVLVYKACGTSTINCYSGTPLYLRVRQGGPYDIAAQTVPGRGAPVVVRAIADKTTATALFGTDEGVTATSQAFGVTPGETSVSFTNSGPHSIIVVANNGTRPPGRMAVCVSEGNDGFCGSTRVEPPPEIPYAPSPCDTNGHDGLCGTTDTSGPVTHVLNIINKKVYNARKGPGTVSGTIDTDPNGVQDVKLRLTRVSTARVLIKAKKSKKSKKKKAKKRYRTVKRCTAWSDTTALLEPAKCGTKNAKWFTADLSDLRNQFTYSFAMTMPAGTYTLEVMAADENGFKDAVTAGRNVLVFTVK